MPNETTLAFAVEDMTCGHCVRTITTAVEAAFPGAKVSADTATHRVTVSGISDVRAVSDVIAAEGYTPVAVDAAA
ncbi:heavy-metal-associated domain-containing protein [Rhizobium sp. ARZ01]|uniref:heavy-metal-associated domain-containing protein n=1 Tax=Rhizobium sp. ARZ01 TaxID=2769313 RepID=UPI001784C24D|nr:heavy-metal-associated domain-containing protein [Rhizobium sp. ARZ01]MBD9375126.1 heavy-metal-associated domain-containing protein [Rhizobium sp. ARZ01]